MIAPPAAAIPDADIWRAALLMLKRYGDDAMLEAAERAEGERLWAARAYCDSIAA